MDTLSQSLLVNDEMINDKSMRQPNTQSPPEVVTQDDSILITDADRVHNAPEVIEIPAGILPVLPSKSQLMARAHNLGMKMKKVKLINVSSPMYAEKRFKIIRLDSSKRYFGRVGARTFFDCLCDGVAPTDVVKTRARMAAAQLERNRARTSADIEEFNFLWSGIAWDWSKVLDNGGILVTNPEVSAAKKWLAID